MIKQGFLRCRRGQKKKEKGEKENRAKRWCTIGSWPPAAQPNSQHKTTARLSRGPTEERNRRRVGGGGKSRWANSEGQGLNRAWLPGRGGAAAAKISTLSVQFQARAPRRCAPARTEVTRMDKRDWNSPALAERLRSGYKTTYRVFGEAGGGGAATTGHRQSFNTSIREKGV